MGGVVGAVSGKFVLAAAGILVASRVDHERVNALIDPSLAHTEISRALADRLEPRTPHAPGQTLTLRHGTMIGLGAKEFDAPGLTVGATHAPPGIDLVIGRDILEAERIDLDFVHRQLSLVTPGEYRAVTRGRVHVPLTAVGPSLWRLTAKLDPGGVQDGILDLASPDPLRVSASKPHPCPRIAFDSVWLDETGCVVETSSSLSFRLGLRGFSNRHVLLDLAHQSAWILPSRARGNSR